MKFLCGGCRTKYQLSDAKVRGKILTIRCKKCGAQIVVRESLRRDARGGTVIAPLVDEASGQASRERSVVHGQRGAAKALPSAFDLAMERRTDRESTSGVPVKSRDSRAEWYVAIDGQQHGPYAFSELVRRVGSGEVRRRHYVWHDGMENWLRVYEVPDVAAHLPPEAKRKPPPPPPPTTDPKIVDSGGGADVVDFASRRAERLKGADAGESGDADIGTFDLDDSESSDVGSLPATDGEPEDEPFTGKTEVADEAPKAPERAIAVAGTAGVRKDGAAEESGLDELLAFDSDDIFANVPRASEKERVSENTRFFVQAAGVNARRSRRRMGYMVGAGIVASILLFCGLWAAGVVDIQLTPPWGAGPFAQKQTSPEVGPEVFGPEENPAELGQLLGREKKQKPRVRPNRRRTQVASATGDYITDKDSGNGPRGAGLGREAVPIQFKDMPSGTIKKPELPMNSLGQSGVDLPVVDRASLSEGDIARVIKSRIGSLTMCYQKALRTSDGLKGKVEFKVTISPKGNVSRASIHTNRFKGSRMGQCMLKKIKAWVFPSFSGGPRNYLVPFVLTKAAY